MCISSLLTLSASCTSIAISIQASKHPLQLNKGFWEFHFCPLQNCKGNFNLYYQSFYLYFYWCIIALQYCVSLCHTTKWINYMYTYIPSLLNLLPTTIPPPRPSQHGAELPALYSSFPLAILHMIVNICQSYSPSLSHIYYQLF